MGDVGKAESGAGEDVFRFALLLLTLLSGRPAEEIAARLGRRSRPSAIVGRPLSPGFEFVLCRCTTPNPAHRYRDGSALAADVAALAAAVGPLPPVASPPAGVAGGSAAGRTASEVAGRARPVRGFWAWAALLALAALASFLISYGAAAHQVRLHLLR